MDTEEKKARKLLKSKGYYVENLWSIKDVKSKFICTDEEAMNILTEAFENSTTYEHIWEIITVVGEEMGFQKTFEVGDYIVVCANGLNDTLHKLYKKNIFLGDVFKITSFQKASKDDLMVAIGERGEVAYTSLYPNYFRKATEEQIFAYNNALPKINGQIGVITENAIKYGTLYLDKKWFSRKYGNEIAEIVLDCGTTITRGDIKQIKKVLNAQ